MLNSGRTVAITLGEIDACVIVPERTPSSATFSLPNVLLG